MTKTFWFIFVFLLTFLAFNSPSRADWINLTGAETSPNIAEIYVLDDRVRVALEVYINDLKTFEELVPDSWLKDAAVERPELQTRQEDFSAHKIQVVADGERLTGQFKLIEPRLRKDRKSPFAGMINPYTRQRAPEPPQDKRVLYAEIEFPFTGKPDEIMIVPPVDGEGRALVTIGFIAYHKSVPVIDFRYLGARVALNLDWEDPWYSKFDNPNLKRHHKSALMSFLYVEPYEVRHEILVRVKDLENWIDLGLRGGEFIESDELEPLKQRVGEFLRGKNPVNIDGEPAKPILDRIDFVKVATTGIQIVDQPQRLEISTAIVGVILAYITDGMPREVTADWELFTDQIQRVPVTATDPAGPLQSYVDPQDNVHKWTNFLKNYQMPTVAQIRADERMTRIQVPLVTLVLVIVGIVALFNPRKMLTRKAAIIGSLILFGAGAAAYPFARTSIDKPAAIVANLPEAEVKPVLQSLLDNVYRAFDFREEDDVYDKLAISVDGDLLVDVYLQNRKSMQIQRAGGAQARVREVELLKVKSEPNADMPLSYDVTATWSAMGTVGHWGHIHTRKNLYDAMITMSVVDGVWKITGLNLLEEKRVDPYSNEPLDGSS